MIGGSLPGSSCFERVLNGEILEGLVMWPGRPISTPSPTFADRGGIVNPHLEVI